MSFKVGDLVDLSEKVNSVWYGKALKVVVVSTFIIIEHPIHGHGGFREDELTLNELCLTKLYKILS